MPTENASVTASSAPKKGKKYFSVSEANRALPYVSRIVSEVIDCYQIVVNLRHKIGTVDSDTDDQERLQDEYERSMDRLNELLDELQQVGVELKDFEKGLLDFPAVHDGREIYLCWHFGEAQVEAWHELEAGYQGRQDVSLLDSDLHQ